MDRAVRTHAPSRSFRLLSVRLSGAGGGMQPSLMYLPKAIPAEMEKDRVRRCGTRRDGGKSLRRRCGVKRIPVSQEMGSACAVTRRGFQFKRVKLHYDTKQ